MSGILQITEDFITQAPGKVFIIVIPVFSIAIIPVVLKLPQIIFHMRLGNTVPVGQFIVRG